MCGKVIAYQDKTPDGFRGQQLSINSHYVDGISLTHGQNPRKHIWTFVAALDEVGTHPSYNCPCTNVHITSPQPPTFIGNDYFVIREALTITSTSFMATTHYGMELAVDQQIPAAL